MAAFDDAFAHVVGVEGKYCNDPRDAGGATCWGITVAVARANGYVGAMPTLPLDTAKLIYRKRYWIALGLDFISTHAPKLAGELFDSGVNCGVHMASVWLQRALNGLNNGGTLYPDIPLDGSIGNATIRAFDALVARRGTDAELVLQRLCDAQQGSYYLDLALNHVRDEAFLFGWIRTRVGA